MSYGARLRFRSTKGLSSDATSISFEFHDFTAELLAAPDGKTLRDSSWFILRIRNFPSHGAAKEVGGKLRTALQLASIRRFWGVDVGEDKVTSALFRGITDELAEDGQFVRSNVHGLDIYEDRPGTSWFWMEGRGSVSVQPEGLIDEVSRLFGSVPPVEPDGFDAVRLLNEALISQEAAAQLVLAIAAVEHLAQGEQWTDTQRAALERLAVATEADPILTPDERFEVAEMLRKSLHRMSVRQSQRRLLLELGLGDLWKSWDDLYGRRSAILHGLTYSSNATRSTMVHPALSLCGRIVLTAMARHIQGAADNLDVVMPLPADMPI